MTVLLISTNRFTSPDCVYPLGLTHLSAALRKAGHRCELLDFQIDAENLVSTIKTLNPALVGISLRNIDDVLIRKKETFFGGLPGLVQEIRQHTSSPIVLGGSGFSIFPKELLEFTGADFGIRGEAETSLIKLLTTLQQPKAWSHIPGLVMRRDGVIIANPPGEAGDVVNPVAEDRPKRLVEHYLRTSGTLNLQTQRGCALGCCYCTYPLIEGRRIRRRPPEAIAEEMRIIESLGAKFAFIVDSVFNSSPAHVAETCEAIIKANLKLRWGCFLRPHGLSQDLVKLMARAGLSHAEFGTDSFSDEVLHAYGKHFTFDDVLKSSNLLRQERIDYCHFLIAGGPGETVDTIKVGFENSRRLEGAVMMAVVGMRIYPGTRLHELALREGVVKPGANLLDPVYYLAPGFTTEGLLSQLQDFSRKSPGWIPGDQSPSYTRLVERLRQRGVVGPLWSYFSMIQHLWPQSPAAT